MEFKVGDIVEWCGCRGFVNGEYEKEGGFAYIEVYFNDSPCTLVFTKDGKQYDWHKEPSLKLIAKAKAKTKTKKYKVLFVDIYDEWQLSSSYYETVEKFDMHNIYKVKMLLEQTMVEDDE